MKNLLFLAIFVPFCIANGLLRRKIAEFLESYLVMIFIQGVLQTFVSIFMTKKHVFFHKKIFFLVICSYIAHIILWKSNKTLRSITMSLIEPSRVVFVTFLTIFLVGKKYSKLQFSSLVLIMIGIVISAFSKDSNGSKDQLQFIFLALIGCFTNAVSSVAFYKFFSGSSLTFWSYIFTFSVNAMFFYSLGLIYEVFFTDRFNLDHLLKDKRVYCMHITTTLEYLGYRYIGFFVCPVEKNLVLIVINISIPIFFNLFFDFECTWQSVVAIICVYLGAFGFEFKNLYSKYFTNGSSSTEESEKHVFIEQN